LRLTILLTWLPVACVELLFEEMTVSSPEPQEILLPTKLVVRSTTARRSLKEEKDKPCL